MLNAFDIRQGNSLEMIKNYRDNAFDLDVRHTRYFSNGKDRTKFKEENLISDIF